MRARRTGRPGILKEIKRLIVKMATANSTWGYSRIQGELKGLGHRVARTTIASVLKENGIGPAPERPSSWRSFLRAHWGDAAAIDFFTTEVWTRSGLATYYVLFVIDRKSRRAHLAGVTRHPEEGFMAQVARNLADCMPGFLRLHKDLRLVSKLPGGPHGHQTTTPLRRRRPGLTESQEPSESSDSGRSSVRRPSERRHKLRAQGAARFSAPEVYGSAAVLDIKHYRDRGDRLAHASSRSQSGSRVRENRKHGSMRGGGKRSQGQEIEALANERARNRWA